MNRNAPENLWTDEAVALLTTEYLAGRSHAQISETLKVKLGVVRSRNAVIGKAYRLGLVGHAPRNTKPSAPRRTAPAAPGARAVKVAPPIAPAPAPPPVELQAPAPVEPAPVKIGNVWPVPSTAKPTIELGPRDCKFPVGPATSLGQLHCGARRPATDPAYCDEHREITGGRPIPLAEVKIGRLPRFARS